ncbi:hypothetical protein [Klebsiella phage vB_KpnS-VAC112]|uniref:Uncharacterized protein n=1 Tax=Klebsiella phage vB_KpnS-VAC112 TaxID=2866701 RepID=A0A8K1YYY3_9CAUD|nr:hypothetical protein [Klebsiella phage vB_KpnS-VAC112]
MESNVEKITPAFELKIASVGDITDGQCALILESGQEISDPIVVTEEYIQKYDPQPGGYYIMCEGGNGLYSE